MADSPQENVLNLLSAFSCSRDKDVESFLKEKAIVREKKHISRTYLIFRADAEPELVAYFTLAIGCMGVSDIKCSNELLRKMNVRKDVVQNYLIGQLGKCDGGEKGLGKLAISYALARIKEANIKVGCRVIRVDCGGPLIEYYTDNGFKLVRQNAEGNLNQMVCIIGD
ncbi:MAG: hypothetical protein LBE48_06235 [Methanomassiliicoccaceae archaeon]|jgi:hypothetical protein|nr:hypothetical protein [Methanomassiliicoccaceae archaeon]